MKKVLLVLMDAIEPSLVEKWTEDGSLPNLRKLRAQGRYGRLTSDLKLAGLPWLPLYTGRSDTVIPPYLLAWNPESMTLERLPSKTLDVPIFWRNFQIGGPRVIALDMPFVSRPRPFNGLEVTAWMTHDTLFESVQTFPEELRHYLIEKFGGDLRFKEKYGVLHQAEFLQVRDRLIHMTKRVTDLALDFIQREKWDLFILGYSTLHSAGHKLWDQTNVQGEPGHETTDALQQVYIAADQALGRLLDALDEETVILVFSVHGMQSNSTCNEVLPEMLGRVLADHPPEAGGAAPASGGLLRKLRQFIPYGIRHSIKSRLPRRVQDFLTSFWRSGVGNWQRKKAFTIASDNQGMIRLNLLGREKRGALPPEEYDAVCRQIQDGLKTFVDTDTGAPLIRDIFRTDTVFKNYQQADFHPDLLIDWADMPAAGRRSITSPVYGSITWPTPGHNPDGRSGNHTITGILLIAGAGVKPGAIDGARAIDIAPTVLSLLGQPVPEEMDGRPLTLHV